MTVPRLFLKVQGSNFPVSSATPASRLRVFEQTDRRRVEVDRESPGRRVGPGSDDGGRPAVPGDAQLLDDLSPAGNGREALIVQRIAIQSPARPVRRQEINQIAVRTEIGLVDARVEITGQGCRLPRPEVMHIGLNVIFVGDHALPDFDARSAEKRRAAQHEEGLSIRRPLGGIEPAPFPDDACLERFEVEDRKFGLRIGPDRGVEDRPRHEELSVVRADVLDARRKITRRQPLPGAPGQGEPVEERTAPEPGLAVGQAAVPLDALDVFFGVLGDFVDEERTVPGPGLRAQLGDAGQDGLEAAVGHIPEPDRAPRLVVAPRRKLEPVSGPLDGARRAWPAECPDQFAVKSPVDLGPALGLVRGRLGLPDR